MTKLMRLTRGADKADMRGYPSFKDHDKYIFHSLEGNAPLGQRGNVVTVTDAQAEEMLTHPTLIFEEVTEERAAGDRYRNTLVPDALGHYRDPRTGAVVDRADPDLTEPVTIFAAFSPTPPADVRASVKHDLAALAEQEAKPEAVQAAKVAAKEASQADAPTGDAGKQPAATKETTRVQAPTGDTAKTTGK